MVRVHAAGRPEWHPENRSPKRIGIDTRNIALPQGTGVAAYAATLAEACRRTGSLPQFLNARKITSKTMRFAHALLPSHKVDQHFSAPDIYRVGHLHFKIYQALTKLRVAAPPDLMHWTYPLPLFLAGCKNIVTIHDLIPLSHPELTRIDGTRLRRLLSVLFRRFDGIVTVSETIRAEIINRFGICPSRVQTVYPAVDIAFAAEPAPPSCPPQSLLVIGTVEKRKNIRTLIAAYQASNAALPLVLIGPDGEGAAAELAGMGDGIIRIPYLSRAALLATLQQARAVLFPSLAEGFGLPIIEAFACAVPVMTSRGGATEEIAGGAALLVDPSNFDELSRTIGRLAQDDMLCAQYAAYGLQRSRFFCLDAYAGRLANYYQRILNSD